MQTQKQEGHPKRVLIDPVFTKLKGFLVSTLREFPWGIDVCAVTGSEREWYTLGQCKPHWRGDRLTMTVKTRGAAQAILALDGMEVLERFVTGEIDLEGNLYLLTWIRQHANLELGWLATARQVLANRAFQDPNRAGMNVKSHYDIPQEVLDRYLDVVYKSYSCGIFEEPDRLDVDELLRVGAGKDDDFDSLEKAQWRKFRDAVDYVRPSPGDRVLDIGCGYAGQLVVGRASYPDATFVGWTHSENQVREGARMLAPSCGGCEADIRLGDYREDTGVYDHVLSTGMISHVGPRGLIPYVKEVRKRIKTGGRYLHHALMRTWSKRPLDGYVGAAFNKKYVWPGFHWFTVAEHFKALEENGFRIVAERNLSRHYGKTTAAWYERMMAYAETIRPLMGEQTFRAWQIYLSGASAGFHAGIIEVHRIYCEAR